MAWGVKDMPIEARFAKALEAGANIFSGQKDFTADHKGSRARFSE